MAEQRRQHSAARSKRLRWKYLALSLFAVSVIGTLSWAGYYDLTVLQPMWEAEQKAEQEKEKAAFEKQQRIEKEREAQEEVEWAHCVDSKGGDPVCKQVCIKYDESRPGFMAFSGVDCRKFGVMWKDEDKEEVGLCEGSKGNDPICKNVCIAHGRNGELAPFGIDCTKFGIAVDNRLPFEKQMDEEQRNFDQAVALCSFGNHAACEYRRGDPGRHKQNAKTVGGWTQSPKRSSPVRRREGYNRKAVRLRCSACPFHPVPALTPSSIELAERFR